MRQAYTPACLIFFCGGRIRRMPNFRSIKRFVLTTCNSRLAAAVLVALALFPFTLAGQAPKASAPVASASAATPATPEKALALAQQGHCKEALPGLNSALRGAGSAEVKKNAGAAGLRCALAIDDRASAGDFIRMLSKQFPNDPDILFILVHAYSDLSTRTAQDLGRLAPQSIPARKLSAEALEMQGKWDEAKREYEAILTKDPNARGIHFLLGRLYLSRPDADAKSMEQAKQEFSKELEIDPQNAGAHYVLGQIASKNEAWDQAVDQFSQAAKLDANFAEAYLGWGFTLMTLKRYEDAIAPLRRAEVLTPGNPAVHYALATALSRTGHKEEAELEFEIHRSLTASSANAPGGEKPK
jgi:tetratricopeptide (TPR) repeat protein